MNHKPPRFSLVLATVGRTEELERAIRSFANQTFTDFELLLVDQNPDDRLLPFVALANELDIAISHIRLEKPNLSKARNLGIQQASGQIIAFPDDDCWYEPTVLEHVNQAIGLNEDVGAVVKWVEQSAASPLVTSMRMSVEASFAFRDIPSSSITLFLPRAPLIKIGGFDERLGVGRWYGAGEETDLVLRLLRMAVQILYIPEARVHHFFSTETYKKMSWQATRKRARGTGAIYIKNEMALRIIVRGIFAPFIKPVLKFEGLRACFFGLAVSLGRLEGLVGWLFRPKETQNEV